MTNVSLNFPKIQEGPNTYSPFIELVETKYWETNRYLNYTEFKLKLAYRWKTEIKLFVNSCICNFLVPIVFYRNYFSNTLFKCHSVGSGFTRFGYENDKLFI